MFPATGPRVYNQPLGRFLLRLSRTLVAAYVCGELLCASATAEPKPKPTVTLKVSPIVSFAPSTIRFTITIEPFAGNRKACLTYDGGEAGESCWQVDGDTHARTQWFERRIGGEGEYFAVVTLVSIICKEHDPNDCKVVHTAAQQQFRIDAPGVPFVR